MQDGDATSNGTDQLSDGLKVELVDLNKRFLRHLRLGSHLVEIRAAAGHQDLIIDGRSVQYFVTPSGYTLHRAAFSSPSPTLLEAVSAYLGVNLAAVVVLSDGDVFDRDLDQFAPEHSVTCGRKDFMQMNSGERDLFACALNEIYAEGVIEDLAQEHDHEWTRIHYGPAFLPWHRHFLLRFEHRLKSYDSRLSLPFWDWTRNDSQDLDSGPWSDIFGGRANSGGRFDHWSYQRAPNSRGHTLPSLADIFGFLRRESYKSFRSIETLHHAGPHQWVGGDMESTHSPRDPLFYLHHCNLDRLWAIWQRNHADADQYSADSISGDLLPEFAATIVPLHSPMAGGATPESMLDHTNLDYIYRHDSRIDDYATSANLPPLVTGDDTKRLRSMMRTSFGQTAVGDIRTNFLSLRNSGSLPIEVRIDPRPLGDGAFSWGGFDGTLFPCRHSGILVSFRPTALGAHQESLVVTTDARGSPREFVLSGTGRAGPPQ